MEERPVSVVLREIVQAFTSLVQSEIRLAKAEMTQNFQAAAKRGATLAVCGVFALFGVQALIAFLIIGLGDLFGGRYWLSSLLVTLLLLVPAGILGFAALQKLKAIPTLPISKNSIDTDREIVAERMQHLTETAKQRAS